MYGSTKDVPPAFGGTGPQDGQVSPMMEYNPDHAFYAFNLVANWGDCHISFCAANFDASSLTTFSMTIYVSLAYSRWDLIYPDVLKEIKQRGMTRAKKAEKREAIFFSCHFITYSLFNHLFILDTKSSSTISETLYQNLVLEMDKKALVMYENEGVEAVVGMVTDFTKSLGETLVKDWNRYDGNIEVTSPPLCYL